MKNPYIVDGHCDSLISFVNNDRTLNNPAEGGQWDIHRARQTGVALQFLAAFIETKYKPTRSLQRGLQLIEGAHRFIANHPDEVFLVQKKLDLDKIPDPTRLGILLSVEGGEILGEDLFILDIIFKLGVRALGLTWNQRNALAAGVGEPDTRLKLSVFGQEVVQRMNKLGMIVDVSHLNETGFWHVLEVSKDPIAATHSCAKALCEHPRNLTDQQLRALGRHKGVVGVNFYPQFLKETGVATRDDVVRHICHIAEVAGVETVGLGSDFDGIEETPDGLEQVGEYHYLQEDLIKIGFSNQEVEQIMGRNLMRLLTDVLK
ncbi:membrane dipeptidase [Desulfosporosinus fructosivorans]|uniref:Membrane dipeptidase n=1 Tax=Desulfosporosinus fructosivorans TaxID=2018669 RepID=A0A4Z0QY04_9FIRM|nr:dipeptidase [Desulfosporosinus fructosivorans]TGE35179.1 membrane dipeptidase [Desulfosporosinus fructosivorans]